ncbi:Spo11/DNA topoisomerase VI subunit A [Xylaria arbuscula]|nr:Spo11/DNA topoisomerase VI subunit A [Xylaria arbuscula]
MPTQDAALQPISNPHTGIAISKIEEILAANLDALIHTRPLSISIRSRVTGNTQLNARRCLTDLLAPLPPAAILQILHLSREALVAGRVITMRDIYYQNPELFESQQYVNGLVDDIAFTFELGRHALNIVAADKGLIAGAVTVNFHNGTALQCNPHHGQYVLIPADAHSVSKFDLGPIKWLLVIEKEATFRGLAASRFHDSAVAGPGILVTAKGYPDLSTRQFLHRLHTSCPPLAMYALVDFDPHGVRIMLTYKDGSRSLQHEQNATLDHLSWLGPRSIDVLGARMGQVSTARPVDTTLPLTIGDRKEAVRIISLKMGDGDEAMENLDLIRELQIMLLFNTKAEIQAVDDAGDLTKWLDNAITKAMEIS